MPKLSEYFHWENDQLTNNHNFIAGIECEIESIRGLAAEVAEFTATTDGSLRNNGYEYISVPLEQEQLIPAFKSLHANLTYWHKDEAFSPRTSTHVHINCRTLTTDQLKTMMLFYALYEEFFFAMVNQDRRHNIHCVPLTETYLTQRYHRPIGDLLKAWHKYTAFNLVPIQKQGTVEFRHLQGTDDSVLLNEWISSIRNLWELCQVDTITRDNITDERCLQQWFHKIFAQSPRIMALQPTLHNKIQNSLIDVKFALI